MDRTDTVKTGDVLLFSGNSPTGFLLRTFVSSEWNHSGIAVRFKTVINPENGLEQKEISLTEEGELYILETNTGVRMDEIFGKNIIGAGFSKRDWVFRKYNRIAVRRLHDVFRTPELARLTYDFVEKYRGTRFPGSSLPFIGVWLGIPLTDKETSSGMFCSEIMAHYYTYTIGPQYETVTGNVFDGKLSTLFGSGAPNSEDLFTPGHYTCINTPNASIFSGGEEITYVQYADMLYVILQPLLIILIVMLAIWMTLPR
jgi:hypothetical protein